MPKRVELSNHDGGVAAAAGWGVEEQPALPIAVGRSSISIAPSRASILAMIFYFVPPHPPAASPVVDER